MTIFMAMGALSSSAMLVASMNHAFLHRALHAFFSSSISG
jgi:hypothetical protein